MTAAQSNARAPFWPAEALEPRIVRYDALIPCLNAFVDTRTPGSETKENFTIIGPGVAENPDQHVHIVEPHGFNIGAARQPPGCTNSQHSHDTAEVFFVHSGDWRFDFGEYADDAQIEAAPGDIVSFPISCFRGFSNIGNDAGFLWAVLGGDDPGRVIWAPQVFELAANHGLVLLESGSLIDVTLGQTVPEGDRPMPVTSPEMIARLRRMQPADAGEVLAKAPLAVEPGETLVIGPAGQLPAASDFTLSRLILDAGDDREGGDSLQPEVLFVHRGEVDVITPDATLRLRMGDTMTVPETLKRRYASSQGAELIIVRGTGRAN